MSSYVYLYTDPRTDKPVYVGKGTGGRAKSKQVGKNEGKCMALLGGNKS